MSGNYQEYISKIFLNDEQAKDKIEKLRKDIEGYREAKKISLFLEYIFFTFFVSKKRKLLLNMSDIP